MFIRTLLLVCLTISYAQAQDLQYVSAENGLIVRAKPSRGADRIGTIEYGTQVEITEHTNLKLDVLEGGKKISGEWVKIRGTHAYEVIDEGYVFNGFLTEEKLKKRFKISFDEFTVSIKDVSEIKSKTEIGISNNILSFKQDVNETVIGKTLSVKHHQDFRTIEVFQKHENSIAIIDKGSHCDIIDWEHYYSSWKPLKTISSNRKFETRPISKKESSDFIEINIENFKTYIDEMCGNSWGEAINDVKSIKDYPISVKTSKVLIRVIMTDLYGIKTEKIIIFEISSDCNTDTDSYAKL
jgi:hypothetical protein